MVNNMVWKKDPFKNRVKEKDAEKTPEQPPVEQKAQEPCQPCNASKSLSEKKIGRFKKIWKRIFHK